MQAFGLVQWPRQLVGTHGWLHSALCVRNTRLVVLGARAHTHAHTQPELDVAWESATLVCKLLTVLQVRRTRVARGAMARITD